MEHMTGTENSKEIGDINLAYMLLAQRLLKRDRATAMFRLGGELRTCRHARRNGAYPDRQAGLDEFPPVQLPF